MNWGERYLTQYKALKRQRSLSPSLQWGNRGWKNQVTSPRSQCQKECPGFLTPHTACKGIWNSWDQSPDHGSPQLVPLPRCQGPAHTSAHPNLRGLPGQPLAILSSPGLVRKLSLLLTASRIQSPKETSLVGYFFFPLQKNKFINGAWQAVYYLALMACLLPGACVC